MTCGKSIARRSKFGAERARRHDFFGADVESMSPGARVATAISVIVPVALSGVFLFAFVPDLWWILTIYGWVAFPAFGLLAKGLSQNSRTKPGSAVASTKSPERELLEALWKHGELTPARAAMETSLSVAEADGMLGRLAGDGHLEVRAKDGGVFYSLWRSERDES